MVWKLIVTALIIVIPVVVILSSGIVKVNQYEKGMVERWNAYEKTVGPD